MLAIHGGSWLLLMRAQPWHGAERARKDEVGRERDSDPQLVGQQASLSLAFSMAAEPLTELEMAIETVVKTFFTFAVREGKKGSLSVNEFKELATQQLPHLLKDVGSLDEKMKSLDVNQDSELKFHEYWRLIGELAKEMKKEKAAEIRKK
ncbi:protein S100-A13 isoform X1 [Dromiciops gliroides]|uniref:protein S100-A13 isoform X1 n=2 Tax=Dromiciops gliroides TaxID=33562 RepID=UPI001CC6E7F2|nr:protein S100-A13 isoform X1 [Dromiciops gliroides]